MKKLLFKFLVVIVVCFFSFLEVEADGGFNHISHVTNLDINTSSQKMTIKGFAFIDHMDNYGGVNVRSTVVAKNTSGKSISYDVTYKSTGLDYYYVRCQQTNTGSQVCNEGYANSLRGANRRSNTCNDVGTMTSDCAYFDVEFEVVIDLQELYSELGAAGEEISFSITTVNDIGVSATSEIGVHPTNCSVNSVMGTCGNQVAFGGSTIGISTSSDIVVTATTARARYENHDYAGFWYGHGSTYGALEHRKDVGFHSKYGTNFRSNYYVVNISGTKYIIYDSWVKVKDVMKIVFGGMPEPVIPDRRCDPGYQEINATKEVACGASQEFKGCVDKSVNFGNLTYELNSSQASKIVKPDGSGVKCGDNPSVKVSNLSLTILLHQYGKFTLPNSASSVYAGRSFTFPNLNYYNEFYWKYAKTASGNIAYTATAYYGKWEPKYKTVTHSYYPKCTGPGSLSGGYCDKDQNGAPDYHTWSEQVIDDYICHPTGNSYDLKLTDIVNGEKGEQSLLYYLKYFSTKTVKDNIYDASNYSQEVIDKNKPASYDSNDENDSMVDPVSGKWNRDRGNWYGYEILEEVVKYNTEYTFDLDDAYIKVVGNDDRADITYVRPSDMSNYIKITGNKYFVPLKYPDNEDFPVVVNLSPISFVKNIDWNIFGDCRVNVINKVFGPPDNPGLKVVYRPIDLQNPFPKSTMSSQWSRWYTGSNVNRIKNTMSRNSIYEISLKEGNSKDNILGMNVINGINTNYNDWTGTDTGINKDGSSIFINRHRFGSYFTRKASSSSYCKIGYFNSSCDELN